MEAWSDNVWARFLWCLLFSLSLSLSLSVCVYLRSPGFLFLFSFLVPFSILCSFSFYLFPPPISRLLSLFLKKCPLLFVLLLSSFSLSPLVFQLSKQTSLFVFCPYLVLSPPLLFISRRRGSPPALSHRGAGGSGVALPLQGKVAARLQGMTPLSFLRRGGKACRGMSCVGWVVKRKRQSVENNLKSSSSLPLYA